jgi:starvation-inducible DNA-binding protein
MATSIKPTRADDDTTKKALATPSDLGANATSAIAAELNKLAADAFALYVKTKNFHWHMSGPHFRDYHLLLDDQATQIFATIDPLAERSRKLGQPTLRSIGHIGKLSRIADNDSEFVSPAEMLSDLVHDNKEFTVFLRRAHEVADKHNDAATTSILEVYIDESERRTWFLFEASRGADRTGH